MFRTILDEPHLGYREAGDDEPETGLFWYVVADQFEKRGIDCHRASEETRHRLDVEPGQDHRDAGLAQGAAELVARLLQPVVHGAGVEAEILGDLVGHDLKEIVEDHLEELVRVAARAVVPRSSGRSRSRNYGAREPRRGAAVPWAREPGARAARDQGRGREKSASGVVRGHHAPGGECARTAAGCWTEARSRDGGGGRAGG